MKLLVIGLGNPGQKYGNTRHNAGFWVVDRIAQKLSLFYRKKLFANYLIAEKNLDKNKIILIKPLTYMNRSGSVLNCVMNKHKISYENVIVIYDNMDLEPGVIRLKRKGSSAGHNGIKSITEYMGSNNFMRLSIGIGRPDNKNEVVNYVLGEPDENEKKAYVSSVEYAADAVLDLLVKTPDEIMNKLNRKNEK